MSGVVMWILPKSFIDKLDIISNLEDMSPIVLFSIFYTLHPPALLVDSGSQLFFVNN